MSTTTSTIFSTAALSPPCPFSFATTAQSPPSLFVPTTKREGGERAAVVAVASVGPSTPTWTRAPLTLILPSISGNHIPSIAGIRERGFRVSCEDDSPTAEVLCRMGKGEVVELSAVMEKGFPVARIEDRGSGISLRRAGKAAFARMKQILKPSSTDAVLYGHNQVADVLFSSCLLTFQYALKHQSYQNYTVNLASWQDDTSTLVSIDGVPSEKFLLNF